jgi:pimeloyl-ACP methyl ester carboxylesterase
VTDLHLESFGEGFPALFVHGSFGWGREAFRKQLELADEHRVVLLDRRGFGHSPAAATLGWDTDRYDLAALLDELGPAHLVGQSYGGVVSLLAAALRPGLVRSLVAIEPPAFEVARGRPAVDAVLAAFEVVYDEAPALSGAHFVESWARASGWSAQQVEEWTASFGRSEWEAVESSRRERWPGDAPFDFETLAAASFPKVLARGAWPQLGVPGRQEVGSAYAAVCEVIAGRIGGHVVVFERSGHNPQLQEAEAFNALLRSVWAEAERV